ncbi:MAG: DNA translocase FtsK [Clostridiales bacterium]|nr:DNA translocase FtsK [Clostridiales bacterium]
MAKGERSRRKSRKEEVPPAIRRELSGLGFLALALLSGLALGRTEGGLLLLNLREGLLWLAGKGAWGIPAAFGAGSLLFFWPGKGKALSRWRLVGGSLFFLALLALLEAPLPLGETFSRAREGGGLLGATLWAPLAYLLGTAGAYVLVGALLGAALLLFLQVPLGGPFLSALARGREKLRRFSWREFFFEPVEEPASQEGEERGEGEKEEAHEAVFLEAPGGKDGRGEGQEGLEREPAEEQVAASQEGELALGEGPGGQLSLAEVPSYQLPPLSLLEGKAPRKGKTRQDTAERAKALERTLKSFGIQAKVVGMEEGPAVTRFEVQPAAGVKVSRIAALADDIALSLAASPVRVVAPIPGKAAVGIEVPNAEVRTVPVGSIIRHGLFQQSASRLTLALGEDVAGQPLVHSLERMLHLLIAGATGSGKSVCLNTILVSLLYKARPDEVKLLLVDPKRVELSGYEGIPHLLAPVITDAKKAASALRWLVAEMGRRYELFAQTGARDIHRYNEAVPGAKDKLPFIVLVIDELADLMLVAAREVEDSIQRLAQMARAAGIHLVLATQRPSVDVITGVIKANIPSRIAFAVSSQADSRTILDGAGAEKLLGKGDMLFYPVGAGKPIRAQGAYISEKELERVLDFVRRQGKPQFQEEIALEREGEGEGGGEEDPLFVEALRIVVETRQASVSMLQRRLRVGFTRAGRLVDLMERKGFVGPHQGSKAREVRITPEQFARLFGDQKK